MDPNSETTSSLAIPSRIWVDRMVDTDSSSSWPWAHEHMALRALDRPRNAFSTILSSPYDRRLTKMGRESLTMATSCLVDAQASMLAAVLAATLCTPVWKKSKKLSTAVTPPDLRQAAACSSPAEVIFSIACTLCSATSMYSTHISLAQKASAAPSLSIPPTAILGGMRSASVVSALPAKRATSGLCSHLSRSTRGGRKASHEKLETRASSEDTVRTSQSSVSAPSCLCSSSKLFRPARMGLSLCVSDEDPPNRALWLKRLWWAEPEPPAPEPPAPVGSKSSRPAPSFLRRPWRVLCWRREAEPAPALVLAPRVEGSSSSMVSSSTRMAFSPLALSLFCSIVVVLNPLPLLLTLLLPFFPAKGFFLFCDRPVALLLAFSAIVFPAPLF
mmetsp:Transcript_7518/g.27286  ORF Transcript_7518/g.27286 Transcript_7518/m.27286 type:complete len:388 (-) Transcript_7518:313-1476(-)